MDDNIIRPDPVKPRPGRLDSIDLLRGLVMVIMCLDHVRDFLSDRLFYDATDLTNTDPATFFTRWITHYCAPTFIFLAGTGAYLSGTRGKSKFQLSWFLFTRGVWLAFMEVVINRMMWMFNFDLMHHGAGVFWAIGLSMIGLSILVYFPVWFVTLFGVVMIASHNLLDGMSAAEVHLPPVVWVILHSPGDVPVFPWWPEFTFGTGYCLIPWKGVMAAGYGFGTLLQLDARVRRPVIFALGAAVTLAFVAIRWTNVYGDARLWQEERDRLWTTMSFLNCTKYPPSLLYVLMTLGPSIMAVALFDRPLSPVLRPIVTFGRVPFFFYLLHIPLIHGTAVLIDFARFGWSPQFGGGPWEVKPDMILGYGVSLPMVYLLWITALLILYPPCRWFAGVKSRHRESWLSYF
jgi:uncharacterized membrane protein